MEKKQKTQAEKLKLIKRKKNLLHYFLIYLVCLLAACVVWLSVRYSMRADGEKDVRMGNDFSMSVCVFSTVDGESSFYA